MDTRFWISADLDWEPKNYDDAPECQRIFCGACRHWITGIQKDVKHGFATAGKRPLYCECGSWFCSDDCKGNAWRHPCVRLYECGHPKDEANTYWDSAYRKRRCKTCHRLRSRKGMREAEADRAALEQAQRLEAAHLVVRQEGDHASL